MVDEHENGSAQEQGSSGESRRRWVPLLLWLATGLIILAALVLFILIRVKTAAPPESRPTERPNVEIIKIQPRDYKERLILPARVEADRFVEVSAEIPARLTEWLVEEGASVTAGQKLLRLDVADTQARRQEVKAALEAAKVERRFAQREYKRVKSLATDNIASDAELDEAENRLEQARVAIQQTERQLDVLAVRIAKSVVKAPFAGRLDEHVVEIGAVLAPGQPVARIYDNSHCRVQVDVPDRYVPFLQQDNAAVREYIRVAMPGGRQDVEAHFTVPGLPKLTGGKYRGVRIPATLRRIAQAADPASNSFRVELRFVNPGKAFRQGLLGMADVQFLVYPEAIVIPLRAIRVTDEGPRAVVVEHKEGRDVAVIRDIEPISIQRDQVLVRNGLKGQERLVVSGGKGIVHGEEVHVLVADGQVQPKDGRGRPYDLAPGYQPGQPATGEETEETP